MQATFGEVLESIEELSLDEKEDLIDILQHRLRDYRRARILSEIENSEREFEQGLCKEMTVDEFMKEVLS